MVTGWCQRSTVILIIKFVPVGYFYIVNLSEWKMLMRNAKCILSSALAHFTCYFPNILPKRGAIDPIWVDSDYYDEKQYSSECPKSNLNITLEPFFVMFHNTADFLHFLKIILVMFFILKNLWILSTKLYSSALYFSLKEMQKKENNSTERFTCQSYVWSSDTWMIYLMVSSYSWTSFDGF